jgi:hypothetical protein
MSIKTYAVIAAGLLFIYNIPREAYEKPSLQASVKQISYDMGADRLTMLSAPLPKITTNGELTYRVAVEVILGNPIILESGAKVVREYRTSTYNCTSKNISVETAVLLDSVGNIVGSFDDLNLLYTGDNQTANDELEIVCMTAARANRSSIST